MSEPTPDEKAQIVVAMPTLPNIIFRYKSVKEAEKQYKALSSALDKYWLTGKPLTHTLKGDVVMANLVLQNVAGVSFAEVAAWLKFTPHSYQRPEQ